MGEEIRVTLKVEGVSSLPEGMSYYETNTIRRGERSYENTQVRYLTEHLLQRALNANALGEGDR